MSQFYTTVAFTGTVGAQKGSSYQSQIGFGEGSVKEFKEPRALVGSYQK